MKILIFISLIFSFSLSHAGRIDNYYREVARVGALKPRPRPRTSRSKTLPMFLITQKKRKFMEAIRTAAKKKTQEVWKLWKSF